MGRLRWWELTALAVGGAATLWGVYAITGSVLAQILALFALLIPQRLLARRAAAARPFPPYPGRPPEERPVHKAVLFVAAIGVVLALQIGLARSTEALFGFEPGAWFWFWVCFAVPLMVIGNRYGVQPQDGETDTPVAN